MNDNTYNTYVLPVLRLPFTFYDKYGTVILYDIVQNRQGCVPLFIEFTYQETFFFVPLNITNKRDKSDWTN